MERILEYGPGSVGAPNIDGVILFGMFPAGVHFGPSFGDLAATEIVLKKKIYYNNLQA